jgi:hypothetical protein
MVFYLVFDPLHGVNHMSTSGRCQAQPEKRIRPPGCETWVFNHKRGINRDGKIDKSNTMKEVT